MEKTFIKPKCRPISLLLACIMVFCFFSATPLTATAIPATSIPAYNTHSITIYVGETYYLSIVRPDGGYVLENYTNITRGDPNHAIAAPGYFEGSHLDQYIVGVGPGTTQVRFEIIYEDGTVVTDICYITVLQHVSSVAVTPTSCTVNVGKHKP